jgi:hypothetical protein
MQSWIKFVPVDKIVKGKEYFIGRHRNQGDPFFEHCDLLGRGLNGKVQWTQKPGIALCVSDDTLLDYLKKSPDFKAVEIPADAAKRWKARTPVRR